MKIENRKYYLIIWFILQSFGIEAQEIDKTFYPDKNVRSEGVLINGIKSGQWKYYYPSGILSSEENYVNDQLSGLVN